MNETKMLDEFVQIRCIFHCTMKKKILVTKLPKKCPLCFLPFDSMPFRVPPFCIPSPFHYHLKTMTELQLSSNPIMPFCILVKPTNGHFLTSYKDGDYLHAGVTDSNVNVFSFDERGITMERQGWDSSLCITMIESRDNDVTVEDRWDAFLYASFEKDDWRKETYDNNSNNCFDYVIHVLSKVLSFNISKEDFCKDHILPEAKYASKYISLYREIAEKSFVLQNNVVNS